MTTPHITTQQQRDQIATLSRLVARRAREEVEILAVCDAREAATNAAFSQERNQAIADFEHEHTKLVTAYKENREAVYARYEAEGFTLVQEERKCVEEASQQHAKYVSEAQSHVHKRSAAIEDAAAQRLAALQQSLEQYFNQCEERTAELQALVAEMKKTVRKRCAWPDDSGLSATSPANLSQQQYMERLAVAYRRANDLIPVVHNQRPARFLRDGWPLLIFFFSIFILGYPCWWLLESQGLAVVVGVCVGVALTISLVVRGKAKRASQQQAAALLPEFQTSIVQGTAELVAAKEVAKAVAQRKQQEIEDARDRELATAQTEADKVTQEHEAAGKARVREATRQLRERRRVLEETYDRKIQQLEIPGTARIREFEQTFQTTMAALHQTFRERRAVDRQIRQTEWRELATTWSTGMSRFQKEVVDMNAFCSTHCPDWNVTDWKSWKAPLFQAESQNGDETILSQLSAVRVGNYTLDLAAVPDGLPRAAELAISPTSYQLPVVLSYPEKPSLLLNADGDGRDAATRVLQNVMLRLLTSFPPGKVRFTIIDPVGLGQNFSAFMHLADFDERLVCNRIWTESTHILQRLTDLTEHMENVIQKYLRNEFASILEYNQQAGEVAEPFQILVIANFPANFSDEAARRLVSIANSGARCGVYTLISMDTKLKLPRNFDPTDLGTQATSLTWDETTKQFRWNFDDLRPLPLALEMPPDDELFTSIVRLNGERAKAASRVEVPFESVLPPQEKWWTDDSRETVAVPLGRAGAKKLQYMRLGKGTSQHVLISGKTGSGKSTLLNAMITNLAIHYSPDELQFYLIDFKKGVEFKAYAACRLPHARVIAIESEREFGMSVLERLDAELKTRGDLLRKHGVQDLKSYRNANPTAKLPRILLIIDEFQEFFTTDDKISHDSSLLLDRLVRQGRAFGIHVLLGSQTLSGAYSLARSTIGQMAVRVALQCSESDAHLILSEDNTAARLLNRPGEAIYNDANGMFEGNHPFQVVWLSDQLREHYLKLVAQMAIDRKISVATPIVFEGNVAADPRDNDLLREIIRRPVSETRTDAAKVWLGSAVAIKDPTEIVFQRQGGRNLLVVGQQEELALGILQTCFVSLAAQQISNSPKLPEPDVTPPLSTPHSPLPTCFVLDGTRPDAPEAEAWRTLSRDIPFAAQIVSTRDAAATVRTIAEEVDRRLTTGEQHADSIFLIVHNLARFRDLKKSDEFGLSRFDEETTTGVDKKFATILREGPAVGVHSLVWCDSFSNVGRWLERQSVRDFELKVLFQMSASDSSNLMDGPAASRLGAHMALLHSEELGHSEKFRPYGVPSHEWLAWVHEQLAQRRDVSASIVQASP